MQSQTAPVQATEHRTVRVPENLSLVIDRADRHPYLLLSFILLVAVLFFLRLSLHDPLWHDELFTYAIAQVSSIPEMMHQLRVIDLNPPLSYLLTRASFHLFGVGTLQCRLPELTGFLLALTCLFLFVRRRVGASYALLATAIFLSTDAAKLTVQARPYGLLLGFTSLALLAWQRSSTAIGQRRAALYDLLLFAALSLLLLSHVFGLLGWLSIALAESSSIFLARRLSRGRAFALVLPLGFTAFYLPLFQNHARSVFPFAFQPTFHTLISFYIARLTQATITTCLTAIILIALGCRRWLRGADHFAFTTPEWVAVLSLIALPGVLILRLWLTHGAFFNRYGLIADLGLALFFTVFLAWWTGSRPAAAILATAITLALSTRLSYAAHALLQGKILTHSEPTLALSGLETLPDPTLPLVDSSGITFLDMNYREPAQLLARTFYLTGGPITIEYAHATIFEGMAIEKSMFHLPANVDTYARFTAQHRRFYVFGTYSYPEDWLLCKLNDDGAALRLIRETTTEGYPDQDVFEVTLPQNLPLNSMASHPSPACLQRLNNVPPQTQTPGE